MTDEAAKKLTDAIHRLATALDRLAPVMAPGASGGDPTSVPLDFSDLPDDENLASSQALGRGR